MKKLLLLFGIVLFFNVNTLITQKSKAVDAIKNAPFILDGTTCGKKFLKNIDEKKLCVLSYCCSQRSERKQIY